MAASASPARVLASRVAVGAAARAPDATLAASCTNGFFAAARSTHGRLRG
jgi:hypothetical protein